MSPKPLLLLLVPLLLSLPLHGLAENNPDIELEYPFPNNNMQPITNQPALTEKQLADFIKANTVAEKLKKQAMEEFISQPKPKGMDKRQAGCASAALNLMLGDYLVMMLEKTKGLEKEACQETGISLELYQSVLQRIFQINKLMEIEAAQTIKQAAVAELTQQDIKQVAQEQFDTLVSFKQNQLEQNITYMRNQHQKSYQRELDRWQDKKKRAEKKLAALPERDQKNREKIKLLQYKLDKLQRFRNNPNAALPAGFNINAETNELEDKIQTLERRITERKQQKKELEVTLATMTTPPEDIWSEDEKNSLEYSENELAKLENDIASGKFLADMEENLENNYTKQEQELNELERQTAELLQTPMMQQAQRDRDIVLEYADSLFYDDSPMITAQALFDVEKWFQEKNE